MWDSFSFFLFLFPLFFLVPVWLLEVKEERSSTIVYLALISSKVKRGKISVHFQLRTREIWVRKYNTPYQKLVDKLTFLSNYYFASLNKGFGGHFCGKGSEGGLKGLRRHALL